MEFYEAVNGRYSVRHYEDRPVEADKLRRVLDTGRIAPSANNKQDWKFVVVQEQGTLANLTEACEQPWIAAVPVIIAVVGLSDRKMLCEVPAAPVDCSIAIDHMTLAAVAEGLGTCWIGHFKQAECRDLLGIPSDYQIIQMLTLGYPKGEPKKEKPRKDFDEVICFEKFSLS